MEDEQVTEMMKNVWLSQEQIKGYKFNCIGKQLQEGNGTEDMYFYCRYCKNQLVTFVTTDLKEAENHSRENNMPMWISKDE